MDDSEQSIPSALYNVFMYNFSDGNGNLFQPGYTDTMIFDSTVSNFDLKSPIFSFTDSEIHQMISERGKKSIFEFLEIQENSILVEIKQWIDDAKSIPIDRLVESIINSNHRELAFLSEPNGEQVWANLNKLISILHNWSLAGDSLEKIRESLMVTSNAPVRWPFSFDEILAFGTKL